ncbi:twin-arginine translocase subunit TatC, partial [Vibrio sp.]|uniref:twin-arginine translocase subunit TatC n=1 Tax=Vibrio sp. TaxID=678 RepID=UPI003D13DA74
MSEQSREMTIWGHLNELRKRLFYSVGALVVGVIISFIFGDQMLQWVARPIGGLENLLSIQVTENI